MRYLFLFSVLFLLSSSLILAHQDASSSSASSSSSSTSSSSSVPSTPTTHATPITSPSTTRTSAQFLHRLLNGFLSSHTRSTRRSGSSSSSSSRVSQSPSLSDKHRFTESYRDSLSATGSRTQLRFSPGNFTGFDEWLESFMSCRKLPALAIGVVKDGQVIYQRALGQASATTGRKVTLDSVFGVGSVTKQFTSTLAVLLQQEGKINLEVPITNYLTGYKFYDPTTTSLLTLTDMLSHRTGLPSHDVAAFCNTHKSRKDFVYSISAIEPAHSIRSTFLYNNWMVATAGYTLGQVVGGDDYSWEQLVTERLFQPLGMNNTYPNFTYAYHTAPDLAIPQTWDEASQKYIDQPFLENAVIDQAAPAGAIAASIKDMTKWIQFQLGNVPANPPANFPHVTAASFNNLHSPHMTWADDTSYPHWVYRWLHGGAYGLNFWIADYRGQEMNNSKYVFHGGDVWGFHAQVALLPERNSGLILLTNADDPAGSRWRDIITSAAFDRMIGLPPVFENVQQACDFPCNFFPSMCSDEVTSPSAPSLTFQDSPSNIAEYVGVFYNVAYGALTFSLYPGTNDTLTMSFGNFPLIPLVSNMSYLGQDRWVWLLDPDTSVQTINQNYIYFYRDSSNNIDKVLWQIQDSDGQTLRNTFVLPTYRATDSANFPTCGFPADTQVEFVTSDTSQLFRTNSDSVDEYSTGALVGLSIGSILGSVLIFSSLLWCCVSQNILNPSNKSVNDGFRRF